MISANSVRLFRRKPKTQSESSENENRQYACPLQLLRHVGSQGLTHTQTKERERDRERERGRGVRERENEVEGREREILNWRFLFPFQVGLSVEEFRSYLSMIGPAFETLFAEQFGGDLEAAFAKLDTGWIEGFLLWEREKERMRKREWVIECFLFRSEWNTQHCRVTWMSQCVGVIWRKGIALVWMREWMILVD